MEEVIFRRQALEMGLVNKVVPLEKLMDEAMELASRLAAGPTRAIGMIKSMLNRSFESDLGTALARRPLCRVSSSALPMSWRVLPLSWKRGNPSLRANR